MQPIAQPRTLSKLRRSARTLAAVAIAVVALSGCQAPPAVTDTPAPPAASEAPAATTAAPAPTTEAPPTTEPASAGTAMALLETIEVKGRAPKTGYDRDQFGQAWADTNKNGCDTRNDILERDLTGETFKPGTNDCVVLTGVLADPFTATTINFVRGADTSSAVQVDHLVALSDAWQKGAQQLDPDTREAFGNDPLNLLAVDGPANQQKSDSDAASWLPPIKAFRCEFVALQTAVKAKYDLWMTAAEKDAVAGVLSTCPDQPAPTTGGVAGTIQATPAEAPVPEPAPEPAAEAPAGEVSYANCTEVRAAGAAPIKVGDPGFSSKFDGDGDGIGCE